MTWNLYWIKAVFITDQNLEGSLYHLHHVDLRKPCLHAWSVVSQLLTLANWLQAFEFHSFNFLANRDLHQFCLEQHFCQILPFLQSLKILEEVLKVYLLTNYALDISCKILFAWISQPQLWYFAHLFAAFSLLQLFFRALYTF